MSYEILMVDYNDSKCKNKDELRKILQDKIELLINQGYYCVSEIQILELKNLYRMYQLMMK